MTSRRVIITSGIIPGRSVPSCSRGGVTSQTSESTARGRRTSSQSTGDRSLETGGSNSQQMTFLHDWRILDPSDIINLLKDSTELLEELLENEIQDKDMDVLVGALGKACNYPSGSKRIRGILNFLQERNFLEVKVTPWITRWSSGTHVSDMHRVNFGSTVFMLKGFVKEVLESNDSVKVTKVKLNKIFKMYGEKDMKISQEVITAVQDLPEFESNYIQDGRDLMLNENRMGKGDMSRGLPEDVPGDFREIPIFPTTEELHRDFKPFLRTNIVSGCYNNVDHYLDVHFRLLREDFVQPLREGIVEYTTALNHGGTPDGNATHNFRVYHNVRTIEIIPSQGGMVYLLQFEVAENLKRIRWEFSKRLMFGSLVCLSRDNFQTLTFGSVANSDPDKLREGKVEVTFDKISEEISQELMLMSFKMAESPSYFEAYRHVLKCLQTIDQDFFPFKQYLISTSKNVDLPKYIRKYPKVKISLGSYPKENDKETLEDPLTLSDTLQREGMNMKMVKVCEETDWPSADELGLDDSQMSAFKAALSEEICLIQGPPGTGKTYLGLKIVETLLRNKHNWPIDGPVLVVCYTNHALDQFLEGIVDTAQADVVRIGGRSSSEKMKNLNICKVTRDKSLESPILRREFGIAKGNLERCANKCKRLNTRWRLPKRKYLNIVFCHMK